MTRFYTADHCTVVETFIETFTCSKTNVNNTQTKVFKYMFPVDNFGFIFRIKILSIINILQTLTIRRIRNVFVH